MEVVRRQFLHFAGAAAAFIASPSVMRAQAQAPRMARRRTVPRRTGWKRRLVKSPTRTARVLGRVYTVYAPAAERAAADAADARARIGTNPGPLDGAIVTIKDLFDVAGEPMRAGSKVLADAPPATTDAPALRRLRAGGAVIVAKTNIDPNLPFRYWRQPALRHARQSSGPDARSRRLLVAGAAVAVADGMCRSRSAPTPAVRPAFPPRFAAWSGTSRPSCGCRPKARFRCPTRSIRSGRSRGASRRAPPRMRVGDGDDPWTLEPIPLQGLRLGIPQETRAARPRSDGRGTILRRHQGTRPNRRAPVRRGASALDDMVRVNCRATFAVAKSWSIHREQLATRAADYDPFVRARIEAGRSLSAGDYMAMLRDRTVLVRAMDARLSDLDALVLPTTPIVAPTIAEVSSSEGPAQECTGPSQSCDRQFLRSLRDFTSAAARGRAAGWTHARCTQWA